MERVHDSKCKKRRQVAPVRFPDVALKKRKYHGLKGEKADAESNLIDGLLEYVAQYAPNALYRDITRRATSLESIWILVRKWAGLKTSGS